MPNPYDLVPRGWTRQAHAGDVQREAEGFAPKFPVGTRVAWPAEYQLAFESLIERLLEEGPISEEFLAEMLFRRGWPGGQRTPNGDTELARLVQARRMRQSLPGSSR